MSHVLTPRSVDEISAAGGPGAIRFQTADVTNEDDVASAVKPELVLDPKDDGKGGFTISYDFVLDPAK